MGHAGRGCMGRAGRIGHAQAMWVECRMARGSSANACGGCAQTCSTVGHIRGPNYAKIRGVRALTVWGQWWLNAEHVSYKFFESRT